MKAILILFNSLIYLCNNNSNYYNVRAKANKISTKNYKPSIENISDDEYKHISEPIIKDGDEIKIRVFCEQYTNVLQYRQEFKVNKKLSQKSYLILDTGSSDSYLYDEGCTFDKGKHKNVEIYPCKDFDDNKCKIKNEEKTIEYKGGNIKGNIGELTMDYLGKKNFSYNVLFAKNVSSKDEVLYSGLLGLGISPSKFNEKPLIENYGKSVIFFERISNHGTTKYIILSDSCKLEEKKDKKDKKPAFNKMSSKSQEFFETNGWFIFKKEIGGKKKKKINTSSKKVKFTLDSGSFNMVLPNSFRDTFTINVPGCKVNKENFLMCKYEARHQKMYFAIGKSMYNFNLGSYEFNESSDANGYKRVSIMFGNDDKVAIIGQNFLRNYDYCLDMKNKKIIFEFGEKLAWSISIMWIIIIIVVIILILIIIAFVLWKMGYFKKLTSKKKTEDEDYEKA